MENYKMGSVCRLCLHKYELDLMQNIFEFYPQYFEIDLTEVIYWIFDIEVRAEDPYTKLICYKCLNVVESVGRYRKFFKTNQIFFHERKCPANFEVETGWYNKKDVGTNTDITDSLHCTETAEYNKTKVSTKRVIKDFTSRHRKRSYKKDIGTNNEVCNEISVKPSVQNTIFSIHNKALDEVDITVSPAINKEVAGQVIAEKPPLKQNSVNKDCINVPKDTLDSITNKSPEHINLQVDIFKNFSLPQVMLPSLEEECLKQGYAKYEDQYYKVNTDSLTIDLEKFNCDSKFYKNFKRTGKYTFKKICAKRKSQMSNIQQNNKKLLENYYYKIPTSALRELVTQSSLKNKDQITNPTLVKTNEVYVSVCEFCSEVFRHKDHLKDHYLKVHGVPMKTIVNPKVEDNMKFKKDPQVLYSTDMVNMKDEMDLGCELSEHVSGVTEPNAVSDYKNAINNINCNVTLNSRNGTVATNTGFPQGFIKDIFSDSSNQDHYFKIEVFDDDSKSTTPKSKYNYNSKTYVFNDHAYAMKIENQFQEKMHPDIANILINELKQIKNIRERMEILKKIRFALYNEINNPTIKSSVLALEEKLQI